MRIAINSVWNSDNTHYNTEKVSEKSEMLLMTNSERDNCLNPCSVLVCVEEVGVQKAHSSHPSGQVHSWRKSTAGHWARAYTHYFPGPVS